MSIEKYVKEPYKHGIAINLHIYESGKKSHVIHIGAAAGKIRIGRKKDRQIRIDYPVVSGNHCELLITNNYAAVKDLGSLHGTFINGNLIGNKEGGQDKYYKLYDGDCLALSKYLKIYVEMIKPYEIYDKHCISCGEEFVTSETKTEFCPSCRWEFKKEFEDITFSKLVGIPKLFEPKNVENHFVMELEKIEHVQAFITLQC